MTCIAGVIVFGVSASGKSCLAERLSALLGWQFVEADLFHSAENVAKMKSGRALTDDDRTGWLLALHARLLELFSAGRPFALACSALKRSYRQLLTRDLPGIRLVYLCIDRATAEARIRNRPGHFMPASLVDSQFATLEEPAPDENALTVRQADGDVEHAARAVVAQLCPSARL